MKFAIIAAGEGSRLAEEGISVPKPLVKINGEPMIDRLIRIFIENGASEIVVIVNELTSKVKEHIENMNMDVPVRLVSRTTPSSMHSFFAISPYLEDDKFCLTTVDTIFREREFVNYINAFRSFEGDGLMAVTDYIDDEKPLYVGTDEDLAITGFHDKNENDRYISGGIYCMTPSVLTTLKNCMERGVQRMRNFQRQLVADGKILKAYPFEKIVDVDHVGDIQKAESFVNQE